MERKDSRKRRKLHIRKTLSGTSVAPRVFVFKSNKYFYVGLADDESSKILQSGMCIRKEQEIKGLAKSISKELKKYDKLVFDRSGYKYHGLVKAFVEELRDNKVNI
ncbi:MAG: 50S ribosomal protein L18 [Candidatus Dojkabacteria bacterium]|jgi:large subunit ribosomal protein L18|nr:50S ribosomal protein L18 [Candidatus Dojkabacteria bacterium]